MTNHTPSDPQPATKRHPRKGNNYDRNHHDTTEQDAHTGTGDGSPTSTRPNRTTDNGKTRPGTDRPEPERQSTPARRRQRESYAAQQARLDAEAVDRWAVLVADMSPLSDEQIRALAVILNRIDSRLTREQAE